MEKDFSTKGCFEVIAPLLSDYVFLCDRLHEMLEEWNRMVAQGIEMLIRRRGRWSRVDVWRVGQSQGWTKSPSLFARWKRGCCKDLSSVDFITCRLNLIHTFPLLDMDS